MRKQVGRKRNSAALSGENALFSDNGILGTQSVSRGPVGNVFVSSSNWQGTKSIKTHCRTCLYSVSHARILSLPQPSERTSDTVTKRAVTDVCRTTDRSSGTFWTLLFAFWMQHSFESLPFCFPRWCGHDKDMHSMSTLIFSCPGLYFRALIIPVPSDTWYLSHSHPNEGEIMHEAGRGTLHVSLYNI